MRPRLVGGWVVVDYAGSDGATIHLAVGSADDWRPAFRDYENGQRVVQVRPPADLAGRALVWLRVDGAVTGPGAVNL
ncbi:MAG: hypothetical protein M3524_09755 [Actinomycetota bacterium]|nr:hypothetical protein [Actinomycetota bacterium]